MSTTPMGEFLRHRRDAVRPADAGLPERGNRRVTGLRREEVAQLAGISVEYYVRLEQGRERNPSPQVLEALAAALLLGDDARAHLFRLAGLAPRAHRSLPAERVDPSLEQLLAAWPASPALVYGRAYDVLATNPLAEALFGGFPPSRNLMRMVFHDPAAPQFYADWPGVAAATVAGFRMNLGLAPHDPRVKQVLREMLDSSEAFVELWERHDVRGKRLETKSLRHPRVGDLTLRVQIFDVRGTHGQELAVYHAEPGSPSADAITLLGMLANADR